MNAIAYRLCASNSTERKEVGEVNCFFETGKHELLAS